MKVPAVSEWNEMNAGSPAFCPGCGNDLKEPPNFLEFLGNSELGLLSPLRGPWRCRYVTTLSDTFVLCHRHSWTVIFLGPNLPLPEPSFPLLLILAASGLILPPPHTRPQLSLSPRVPDSTVLEFLCCSV